MNNERFIEMDFDEWCATYKPIKNHIDKDSSFNGEMFETYGDEVAFIKEQDNSYIWTYGDGDDGGSYIWNGWSFVNRIGYFITEVPCPIDTTIQIKVSSYWYYCEGCSAEIEDDGQLINEKFYDFDCCPQCATPQQLKEIEEANA
jgi:hypothetical protein